MGPFGPHLARSMGPVGPCRQAPAGFTLSLLFPRLGEDPYLSINQLKVGAF